MGDGQCWEVVTVCRDVDYVGGWGGGVYCSKNLEYHGSCRREVILQNPLQCRVNSPTTMVAVMSVLATALQQLPN